MMFVFLCVQIHRGKQAFKILASVTRERCRLWTRKNAMFFFLKEVHNVLYSALHCDGKCCFGHFLQRVLRKKGSGRILQYVMHSVLHFLGFFAKRYALHIASRIA